MNSEQRWPEPGRGTKTQVRSLPAERHARLLAYRAAHAVTIHRDRPQGWRVYIGGELKAQTISFAEARRLGRKATSNPEDLTFILDDDTRLETRDCYPWPPAVVIVRDGCELPVRFRTALSAIEFWDQNAHAYQD